jgi:hypothetical protein
MALYPTIKGFSLLRYDYTKTKKNLQKLGLLCITGHSENAPAFPISISAATISASAVAISTSAGVVSKNAGAITTDAAAFAKDAQAFATGGLSFALTAM